MCGLLAEQIIVYWTVTISVSFLLLSIRPPCYLSSISFSFVCPIHRLYNYSNSSLCVELLFLTYSLSWYAYNGGTTTFRLHCACLSWAV